MWVHPSNDDSMEGRMASSMWDCVDLTERTGLARCMARWACRAWAKGRAVYYTNGAWMKGQVTMNVKNRGLKLMRTGKKRIGRTTRILLMRRLGSKHTAHDPPEAAATKS